MRDTERNILNILRRYSTNILCQTNEHYWKLNVIITGYLSINFLHYPTVTKQNNKLVQIHEINPDSHERIKNLIIEVLRGHRKIKKGA